MKKLSLFAALLAIMSLVACNNVNNTDDLSAEEEAIKSVLESDDLTYDEIGDPDEDAIDNTDPNWDGSGIAFGKDGKRLRYGRIITGREGNVEVVFDGDTSATAYISRTFTGKFVTHSGELKNDTLTLTRFEKPMQHNIERIVTLKKVRDDAAQERRNWRVSSVTMADGKANPTQVSIEKVVLYPSDQDSMVITDPTATFFNGNNMLNLPRFSEIMVKVYVNNSTANPVYYPLDTPATETVRLHYGRNRKGNRAIKFFEYAGQDASGNNIYTGTWTIRQFSGYHHAVIDVIDNGTILEKDDVTYPYSSATWGMPYHVSPF
ncbi:MAG: hypothetical protein D6677_02125 [Calditrichaeota bacterium]|nr:MAG: hypothetical protein D6677_02125 [Calditrichota bacterium]